MAGSGAILVVSGFGCRRGAGGGGKLVAILTRGMDLRDLTRLARPIRRIAGRGLYRVRPTAAATIHRYLPITATAVSMVRSIYARRPNVRRMAFNVTIHPKKQSNTAGLTGPALTKK